MDGASRQLCIERIRTENEARANAGMPPLTAAEEDFYREKVKSELKSEFERASLSKEDQGPAEEPRTHPQRALLARMFERTPSSSDKRP